MCYLNDVPISIETLYRYELEMGTDDEFWVPWNWNWLGGWYHEYSLFTYKQGASHDLGQSCALLNVAMSEMSLSFVRQEVQKLGAIKALAMKFHRHLENGEGEVIMNTETS
jgi:hypothetical protein